MSCVVPSINQGLHVHLLTFVMVWILLELESDTGVTLCSEVNDANNASAEQIWFLNMSHHDRIDMGLIYKYSDP